MKTKSLTVLLSVLLITQTSLAELSVGEKLSQSIQSKDIHFDLNLFNLNVGDLASVTSETGIRVFPNKDLKSYSRTEPLKFTINVGKNIPVGLFSVGAHRSSTLLGEFIRQFDSQKDAFNLIKYPPYIIDSQNFITDNRIPFSPERALKLKNKDYFRYQVRTAMTINGSIGQELGILNLKVGKSYVFYGDFQIEIYKKENQKVLVRASSLKQKEKSSFASLGHSYILDVFESSLLNKLANDAIPNDLIKINLNTQTSGSLFAIEYEFDLNQKEAQHAYDQMMNYKNWKFWDLQTVTSGNKKKALQALLMRINDAEERAKLNKGDVKRIIRSTTQFAKNSTGSSFNFRLIKENKQSQFIEQNISLMTNPTSNERQNFRIATHTTSDDVGGWLLFNGAQEERNEANILFELNEQMQIQKFLEMNFSYERSDDKFSKNNQLDTAGNIYTLIPADLHGPGVRDFVMNLSKYNKDEVFIDIDLSFEPRGFILINKLSADTIQEVALDFINGVFKDQAISNKSKRDYGDQDLKVSHSSDSKDCQSEYEKIRCFNENYQKDINHILNLLPQMFLLNSQRHYESQWKTLVALQKIDLFKKIGSGILTRILMKAVISEYNDFNKFYRFAKLRMSVQGRVQLPMIYEIGRNDQIDFYSEIIKIRNRILNREFDPSYF